ncbi:hypothetical protein G3N55_09185, partial [Dissulfurirhabdus thermomarina]|nr:hypothetical protein [Dissulfurirhabdus thermomarina]
APPPPYDIRAAIGEFSSLRADLKLAVRAGGDAPKAVEAETIQALTRAGLWVTPDEAAADAVVICRVQVEDVPRSAPGWHYARAHGAAGVRDTADGRTAATFSAQVREAHVEADEARKKAARALAAKLAASVAALFQ